MEVTGIFVDSRRMAAGGLFVAVRGSVDDGHCFINDAVSRGARAALVQSDAYEAGKKFRRKVPIYCVADTRTAWSRLAARWHGEPSSRLSIVGVTGTNGKTTTAHLLGDFLACLGRTAVLGTVASRGGRFVVSSSMTTPDPWDLHASFREMVSEGIRFCALEVSSHALRQARVDDVCFDRAVFTNLTQDHLDYHGDMESYFRAKRRLYREISSRQEPVINVDDPYGRRLVKELGGNAITYALDGRADYCAEELRFHLDGTSFTLRTPEGDREIFFPLLGRHNVYNFLAAAAVSGEEGVVLDDLLARARECRPVCGRLEKIDAGQPFRIFIDYAHTPDAMEKVLSFLSGIKPHRLITVFGCGGDRDRKKRPRMGRIAERFSDVVVLTSDNPRAEDPERIFEDIRLGFVSKAEESKHVTYIDRQEAIGCALGMAEPEDIVAILGKGHETVQIEGKEHRAFSDHEVVRRSLKERAYV